MATRTKYRAGGVGLAGILLAATLWQAVSAQKEEQQKAPAVAKETEALGGLDRYLTHLSTDKPLYKPGEKVYVRGVVLHQGTHAPLADNAQIESMVEILGPKGDVVAGGNAAMENSVLAFAWEVPPSQAGGEYKVKVTHPFSGHAPSERTFDIRAYRAPRLKSQIKFLRDGYGPGDEVAATLEVSRAEGGIPAGAPVSIVARVDGQVAFEGNTTVDDKGNALARFALPAEIRRGEGTLALVIEDGGVVETASKTIPILLQTVDLTMYPEGGDLVAGVPNRVYLEAFTPAKKPADLAGIIVDGEGKEVASFRSEHEGRGRFSFTPAAEGKYTLKITEPSGIKTEYPLPEVKSEGATISATADVYDSEEIKVSVGSTVDGKVKVVLRQREQELASQEVDLKAGQPQDVTLKAGSADGVLVATVYQGDKPVAERLLFRAPQENIQVSITADQDQYTPAGKVKLTIETKDASGKPISSVVGVTVTDDSVLEMIDKREQHPRLPVMVLLEPEVKELADAHVYFDAENEKAPAAVDLLLATQGWRRFAMVDTAKLLADHGDDARRMLALRLSSRQEIEEVLRGKGAVLKAFNGVDAVQRFRADAKENAKFDFDGAPADPQAAPPPQNAAAAPPAEPAAPPPVDNFADAPVADAIAAEPLLADEPVVPGPVLELAPKSEEAQKLQNALEQAEEKQAGKRLFERDRRAFEPQRNDMIAVRVYAHDLRPDHKPGDRRDFTETLCWHAGLKTDESGKASVEFALNDSVSSFRIFADAFNAAGALGTGTKVIDSVEPFYLEPKLPLEVTSGDYLRVPISIVNATGAALPGAELTVDAHATQKVDDWKFSFDLAAQERLRKMMKVRVGKFHGDVGFTIAGSAGAYADKVTRNMKVVPLGFPIEVGQGGLIQPGDTVSYEVEIPPTFVPGSATAKAVVYPTPLASMTEALERLIQEPYGCFEQTSSTTYPLVMAQQYFMSHQGVDPALIEKSSQILETGYNRLIGFECKSGGFEWFGSDPGHDALTAYGLLEFTDMSQVRHVDSEMLARTRKWLLEQRDGKGGYLRKTHTLHTWLAEPEVANAYNTWALLEAKIDADLSKEVAWVREAAEATDNTYVMALAANVLSQGGDKEGEEHLLDKLAGKQTEDGSLTGATTSVVGSGGEALTIETTSLAVMAWLKNPNYAPQVEKSIKYLAESCKGGRFGSTQSTVLALRAIVAYDQSRAKPKAPGMLQLLVDGNPVGDAVKFDDKTEGAIELPAFAQLLTPGKHKVQVEMTGGSQMPFSVAVNYYNAKPDSSDDCKLHLEVALADTAIEEGKVTEANVTVVNRSNEDIPTPMAIIGIPGGLEVRHDQLKELVKSNKISAYEVLGRDVVLYWRALKAEERVDLPLSLVAAVPGRYTGPASRAYLYYTDEHKTWVDGLTVEIAEK